MVSFSVCSFIFFVLSLIYFFIILLTPDLYILFSFPFSLHSCISRFLFTIVAPVFSVLLYIPLSLYFCISLFFYHSRHQNNLPSPWFHTHTFIIVLSPAVPPTIDDSRSSGDVTVDEGKDVSMTCEARGDPPPVIRWVREGGERFNMNTSQTGKFFCSL